MDDRELLELAAKAAGMSLEWDGPPDKWTPMYYNGKTYHSFDPLTDDGDALRLAVKLRLEVNCTIPDKPTISVYGNNRGRMVACHEQRVSDPYAATRRAIVRAAAEIGKSMAGQSNHPAKVA